jgi:hypothetical protein
MGAAADFCVGADDGAHEVVISTQANECALAARHRGITRDLTGAQLNYIKPIFLIVLDKEFLEATFNQDDKGERLSRRCLLSFCFRFSALNETRV